MLQPWVEKGATPLLPVVCCLFDLRSICADWHFVMWTVEEEKSQQSEQLSEALMQVLFWYQFYCCCCRCCYHVVAFSTVDKMLQFDGCVQLEKLKSECSDKENTICELNRLLSDNSAKLDCVQQEYGVYVVVAAHVMTVLHCVSWLYRFFFTIC